MDDVTKVREKIDIVSLISEYIPLKKSGRNFKALCPFHSENTPSFVVSLERQIWHCFGCSRGGDCFTFLMEYENLEFSEALRMLAKKVGVELRSEFGLQKGITSKKEKLYEINRHALAFYHFLLTKHNVGKKALLYLLEKRNIKPLVVNRFMLGFSPSIGNALSQYLLHKKNYRKEDIIDAGLAFQKQEETVDFFKGRVMFPLFDHRDNVVGFSGRVISDEQESKYINTKDTLVYQKGSHFFGLNVAKEAIKKQERAIVVEGEVDVVSLSQEGIANVIAIKGSALSESQVNLLSRFTHTVSLCFDNDSAGLEAIKRSLPILEKKGFTTRVVVIRNAKDPDESIKKDVASFRKAVTSDIEAYDFLLSKALSLYDKHSAHGKKQIGDEMLPFLSEIENEIVKEHYLKKLSGELDVSYESIAKQAIKAKKKELGFIKTLSPLEGKKSREELLEEYLLALIIQAQDPRVLLKKIVEVFSHLPSLSFRTPAYQRLFEHMSAYYKGKHTDNNKAVVDNKKLLTTIPKELTVAFDTCSLFPLAAFKNIDAYIEEGEKTAEELSILYVRDQMRVTGEKIKEKEQQGREEEVRKLRKEFSTLLFLLRKFQPFPLDRVVMHPN